jgi:hypothetical protein
MGLCPSYVLIDDSLKSQPGFAASHCSMTPTISCSEYARLRQLYEAALRHWGQILLSSEGTELVGAPKRLAIELKQKALYERDAADGRMRLHKQSCPVCNLKKQQ